MSTNFYGNNTSNGAFRGAPESCQVPLENNNGDSHVCGETETLKIIQEFQKLYEEKLKKIDADTSSDSIEAKLKLQQDWIRDLSEQNTMLIQAVEELEQEATERVTMLEERLRQTACVGMACMQQMPQYLDQKKDEMYNNEALMRLNHLQHDATTLLEVIRRAREEGRWYTDGLQFYEISPEDVLGKDGDAQVSYDLVSELQTQLAAKRLKISNPQEKNQQLLQILSNHDNKLKEELENLKECYAELQKSTTDMREALTAEVAEKHDCILAQRREIQLLEEQCRQADKQTHFKDDIIKELRKEIKQGKQQLIKNNIQACSQKFQFQNKPCNPTTIDHNASFNHQKPSPNKIYTVPSTYESVEKTYEKMNNNHSAEVHCLKCPDLSLIDLSKKAQSQAYHKVDPSESSSYSSCYDNGVNNRNKSPYFGPPITHPLSPEKLPKARGKLSIQKVLHEFAATATTTNKPQQSMSIFKYQGDGEGEGGIGSGNGHRVLDNGTMDGTTALQFGEKKNATRTVVASSPSSDGDRGRDEEVVNKVIQVPTHVPVRTFVANIELGMGDLEATSEKHGGAGVDDTAGDDHHRSSRDGKECTVRTKRLQEENKHLRAGCVDLKRQLKELRRVLVKLKDGVNWSELNECTSISPTDLTPHLQEFLKEKGMTTSPKKKEKEMKKLMMKIVQEKDQKIADQHYIVKLLAERLILLNDNLGELEDKANIFVAASPCLGCEEAGGKNKALCAENASLTLLLEVSTGELQQTREKERYHCGEKEELAKKLEEMLSKLEEAECTFEKYRQSSIDEIQTLTADKIISFQEAEAVRSELAAVRGERESLKNECECKKKTIEDLENTLKKQQQQQQRQNSRPRIMKQNSFSEDEGSRSEEGNVSNSDKSTDRSGENLEVDWNNEEIANSTRVAASPTRVRGHCDCGDKTVKSRCTCGDTKYSQGEEHTNCRGNKDPSDEVEIRNSRINQLEDALSTINNNNQLIKNKEEVIRIQNDTLNISEIELQALRQKVADIDREKMKRIREYEKLVEVCKQQECKLRCLEAALQEAQSRADNLQEAVDLYLNSIKLLEDAKQKSEIEVNQQRITICNLQQALVTAKVQIDELQSRASSEFQKQFEIINSLYNNLLEAEVKTLNYQKEAARILRSCNRLRNGNLDLQVAVHNLQQDLQISDGRALKYKNDLKIESETIQNLQKTNQYYTDIIGYMRPEMNTMSEKLKELQNTLSLATTSFQEEKCTLRENVGNLCDKIECQKQQIQALKHKLCQQNQLNHLNNSKIEELQHSVGVKMMAVTRYSKALQDVRSQLDASTVQNREMMCQIDNFKRCFGEYEMTCQKHEDKSAYCQKQMEVFGRSISALKDETKRLQVQLEAKCEEVARLKELCNAQSTSIACLQNGCQESREQFEGQLTDYKTMMQEMSNKLTTSEGNFIRLHEEYKTCQNKLVDYAAREARQQEEFAKQEKELLEKFRGSKEKYNYLIAKLEEQSQSLKHALEGKDAELQSVKDQLICATEERDKLDREKHTMKEHMESLQKCNECLKRQVRELSEDLQRVRNENEHLRQTKDQFEWKETDTQQTDLQEARCAKDEVCAESKTVVVNVRTWLQEQKAINDNLSEVVKRKNEELRHLSTERENLVAMIIDLRRRVQKYKAQRVNTKANRAKRVRLDSTGSRTSTTRSGSRDRSMSPSISSHSSSASADQDRHDQQLLDQERQPFRNRDYLSAEENVRSDRSTIPTVWIRRVHSLTADIQKNNRYWKSKMNELEYMVSKDE